MTVALNPSQSRVLVELARGGPTRGKTSAAIGSICGLAGKTAGNRLTELSKLGLCARAGRIWSVSQEGERLAASSDVVSAAVTYFPVRTGPRGPRKPKVAPAPAPAPAPPPAPAPAPAPAQPSLFAGGVVARGTIRTGHDRTHLVALAVGYLGLAASILDELDVGDDLGTEALEIAARVRGEVTRGR